MRELPPPPARSTPPPDGGAGIEIFSTCPPFTGSPDRGFLRKLIEVAGWSDEVHCRGILVYSDNSQLDPWLVAEAIVSHTTRLCPLVAVQPVYMHPYAVAQAVASFACLHRRRVYLNMVAGGFRNDLTALGDGTPHDERYARLIEYTSIVQRLLTGETVSLAGAYYRTEQLRLKPPMPSELLPGVFVSGSSESGMAAARRLGATAVRYPRPAGEETGPPPDIPFGIRVGIIAREDTMAAWAAARARFPESRRGQIARHLATRISDSVWHKQIAATDARPAGSPYWLGPFENYQSMCPYLVGSHARVAAEIGRYRALGCRALILDVPAQREDLYHVSRVFSRLREKATR